jgi:Ca2+-binding RTX toxin-like protein
MLGGRGNDTYIVDATNNNAIGDATIEKASAGTDLIRSSVSWLLEANTENLTLTGSGSTIGVGNNLNNLIRGNAAANVINGGSGNDAIYGGGGDNELNGDEGNDVFFGGGGSDDFNGGGGTDTVDYSPAAAPVDSLGALVNLNDLFSTPQGSGLATGDTFTAIENVNGSRFNDQLIGDDRGNTLKGNEGNDLLKGTDSTDGYGFVFDGGFDTLYGGAGKDTLAFGERMYGGAGNDTFVVWGDANVSDNRIMDFSKGDRLYLNFDYFNLSSTGGFLAARSFQSGTTNEALSGTQSKLVFNTTDNTLWYDADGASDSFTEFKLMTLNDYNLSISDIPFISSLGIF